MKLIVGLGNPGKSYENTRHNIGFMVLEHFASSNNWKNKWNALYLEENIKYDNVEIRGIGLIWGIDVHSEELSKKIVNECFNNGLILERAGRENSVVKIMPPLTIDNDTLLKGLEILSKAVDKVLK